MKPAHQFLALLVVAIWGTNFVFIRLGLDELPPFTFAALRFALVGLPLVFFIPKPNASWKAIISYGLFIGVGQFGLLFWAMKADISPGLASLIVQMQVFFTVFLSAAFLRERISSMQLLSLFVCLVGLLVIIFYTDGDTTYLGIVLVLLAGLCWALGNIVVKQAGKVEIIAFLAWSSLFCAPVLFAIALIVEGGAQMATGIINLSVQGWLIVVWQTVGNTLIGYGLWNLLLNRYSAATVAPWALLVPVFGMLASAITLAEPMPIWKISAGALIVIGLASNMRSQQGG